MTDSLQALLQSGITKTISFPMTSRYFDIETDTLETVEGKTIVYIRRRFIPPPDSFELLQEHTVTEGDRLDNMTAQYLGDSKQFWRLCDANGAIRPEELTETVGRKVRITLPAGIPGNRNA